LLYFSTAPVVLESVDPQQYASLVEFKKSCQGRGLYQSYDSVDDFRIKFNRHIQLELNKVAYSEIGLSEGLNAISQAPVIQVITDEAKDMLTRACQDPSGHIMRFSLMNGAMIQTNNHSFVDDSNPRSRALWEGVIRELEGKGFIEALGYKREAFQVTREGYKYEEDLKAKDESVG